MTGHSGSYKGDGAKKEKQGTLQSFARPKHCSEARAKEPFEVATTFFSYKEDTTISVILPIYYLQFSGGIERVQ